MEVGLHQLHSEASRYQETDQKLGMPRMRIHDRLDWNEARDLIEAVARIMDLVGRSDR